MKNNLFPYFALAGAIGSFTVVNESGWLMLIPFWILVWAISKVADKIADWVDKPYNQKKDKEIDLYSDKPSGVRRRNQILSELNALQKDLNEKVEKENKKNE